MNKTIKRFLKDADMTNYPNHIGILGTDAIENSDLFFPEGYADYRRKWVENPKNKIVDDFPLHLDIESTNACNLKCIMCYTLRLKDVKGLMEFNLFKRVVDEASRHKVPSIKIGFRGETTLHPQLPDMVKYAKEKGIMEVQFNTNGLLLDRYLSKKLVKAGIDRIIFSLDGLRPQTYNRIRIGSDYKTVTRNIKDLIDIRNSMGFKKPIVRIQMVCFQATKDEVIDFVQHWKRLVNRINLIRYKKPMTTGYDGRRLANIPTRSLPCRQLWQRLAVLWDGRVVMCCGDYNAEMSVGNVCKERLSDIWKNKRLNRVRQFHSQMSMDEIALCRRCEINKVSEGGDWSWLMGKEDK